MSETFRYYARAYQRPQRLEEKPKEVSEVQPCINRRCSSNSKRHPRTRSRFSVDGAVLF
jgi:hypothetical protein